jgi:hypothetical protein
MNIVLENIDLHRYISMLKKNNSPDQKKKEQFLFFPKNILFKSIQFNFFMIKNILFKNIQFNCFRVW